VILSRCRRKPLYGFAACAVGLWTLAFSIAPIIVSLAAAQTAARYNVEIEGVEGDLADLIEASSRLVSGQGAPPFGITGLRRRAESDIEVFRTALRSQGYYGARIGFEIDAETQPFLVAVAIEPGPVFRISTCSIEIIGDRLEFVPENCDPLGLGAGVPALSETVLEGQVQLRRSFLENGYPNVIIERRALVDHDGAIMNLEFTVTPGEKVLMGAATVEGADRADGAFIAELRTWDLGVPYDVRLIDSYRTRLNGLTLFDSVTIAPGDAGEGPRPINVVLREAPPRTIGGGVRFATTEGVGVNGFWAHRNLFGKAETLRVDLGLAQLAQSLAATYSLPHRPNPEQRLDFTALAEHEETDAFTKVGGEVVAALTAPLAEKWRGRIGIGLQLAEIDDGLTRRTSTTASLPADIFYDNSNSLFDPTTGERWSLRATGVTGTNDGALAFLKLESEATAYRRLSQNGRTVIAGRVKIGTILGEELDAIPADRRFYSGGGGSVRGFGYQDIGPRDAMGDPTGGRSVAEAGLELRQRFANTWGGVAFVEAGTMGRRLANLEAPRAGAGVGVRYFTAFGPIRADIAVPFNKRAGDASLQLYISIGQAF
jgi:translocation and assembly module TamA